ncbi:MAG TPA: triple tyrosine motif-containing protein [Paludibacter sp.]|nr:triple tyrosine motif-containing protein [Paludibacter sp.]
MKKYIYFSLAVFMSLPAWGNQPLVRNFTRSDYNAGNQNWGIAQSGSNSMYFANNSGLLEFDGRHWTTYPITNGTNVRAVLAGMDGRFYASTFNDFGYYEEKKNGGFVYYSLFGKVRGNHVHSNELFAIHQGERKIYFRGENTVYEYDGKTVRAIRLNYKIDASACVHNVLFVASEQKGVFMLNGRFFVRIPGSEALVNKKVVSILPFQGNKILFATSFNGVYIFDGSTVMPYHTNFDDFLVKNQVFCAATNGKQLVFGTVQRGVVIQDIASNKVTYINTYTGLQNNTILSATFDNQQNLWLGLDKGIDYVMLNTPIMNMFGTNNLYGSGYTSILDRDILYFGTNQGLYFATYPLPESMLPVQLQLMKGMEGQVWCLDKVGNTLFCGNDQGGFILNNGCAERIVGLPGTWSFKPVVNQPGMVLGCSYQGLFILKKQGEKWSFSHFIKGKFHESSPMFEQDGDGSLWFSHWQKGLFRLELDPGMDSITHIELYNRQKGFPSNRNNTLFRIGKEIVFSSERGFYTYNKRTDRMQPHAKWNNLFSSTPAYIRLHETPKGDVWCVSGRFIGLAKKLPDNSYRMDSLTYNILQPKIITGFEHFNFINQSNVILNTEDGFCLIDMDEKPVPGNVFKVFLHTVSVTNNNISMVAGKRGLNGNLPEKFSHDQNSLRFQFVAPEYRGEGLVKYSYKLENYDANWSEFSPDDIKEYTQLPKGNYVFRVRAHDILEKGVAECSFHFVVLPAWYETQVAYLVYGVLLVMAIVGLIFYVNHKSKKGAMAMEMKKEQELEQQKQQFEAETSEKKREIKELKRQQLQHELRHKSQELASSTMNLIRKNEMLLNIMDNISKVSSEIRNSPDTASILSQLGKMERSIKQNIENDDNWKRFEENFDLVYENYLKRLGETYSDLNTSDKRLCAYLKMDLSSKDIASLMNMSVRSVEMSRYRLRKKMGLDRDTNLSDYLQKF